MGPAVETSADHGNALSRIRDLVLIENRSQAQSAELRSLAKSVSEYENVHHGSANPSFRSIIGIRLKMMGSSVRGMATECPALGGAERVEALASGSLAPTMSDLDIIGDFLKVDRGYLESSISRSA